MSCNGSALTISRSASFPASILSRMDSFSRQDAPAGPDRNPDTDHQNAGKHITAPAVCHRIPARLLAFDLLRRRGNDALKIRHDKHPLAPPIGCASVQLNMNNNTRNRRRTADRRNRAPWGQMWLSPMGINSRMQRDDFTRPSNGAPRYTNFDLVTRSKSPRTARPFHPESSDGCMHVLGQSQTRRRRIAAPGAKSEAA
jgi:hypothetical protein